MLLACLVLFSLVSSAETIIEVTEGDLVNLQIKASDADEDAIEYIFSEPLDENGQWQTTYGDYGEYMIDVTVSDGLSTTSETASLMR